MASGAHVPHIPATVTAAGVQSGRPPRGGSPQWGAYASQANWLLGRGGMLIPHCCIDSDLGIGATHTYRFYVWPRYQATHRTWLVSISTATTGGRAFGTFTDPSGGTYAYSMTGAVTRQTFAHVETISSRGSSEVAIAPTFSLDGASSKTARPVSIGCFEHPRPETNGLALSANDLGCSVTSCEPGAEILETSGAGYSVAAVGAAVAAAEVTSQRNGLYHLVRDTSAAFSTTSAAYTRLLTLGADPILLGRQVYVGATVRTLKVWCYARAGAGTTGNIRFTMTSGDTLVLPVTIGMAATWLSGDLDVDCEDLTDDVYGVRRSPGDKCVIEWQRTGGANSVYIESIGVLGG